MKFAESAGDAGLMPLLIYKPAPGVRSNHGVRTDSVKGSAHVNMGEIVTTKAYIEIGRIVADAWLDHHWV